MVKVATQIMLFVVIRSSESLRFTFDRVTNSFEPCLEADQSRQFMYFRRNPLMRMFMFSNRIQTFEMWFMCVNCVRIWISQLT